MDSREFEEKALGEEPEAGIETLWLDLRRNHRKGQDVTLVVEGPSDEDYFDFVLREKRITLGISETQKERIRFFSAGGCTAVEALIRRAKRDGYSRVFGVVDRDVLLRNRRFDDFYDIENVTSLEERLWILRAWELEFFFFVSPTTLRQVLTGQLRERLSSEELPLGEILARAAFVVRRACAYYIAFRRKSGAGVSAHDIRAQWADNRNGKKIGSLPNADQLESKLRTLCTSVSKEEADLEEERMLRGTGSNSDEDLCEGLRLIDSKNFYDVFVFVANQLARGISSTPSHLLKRQLIIGAPPPEEIRRILCSLAAAVPVEPC